MRTTLEFDADVASMLKRALKSRSQTMKSLVNDLLRRALKMQEKRTPPFTVAALSLGVKSDLEGSALKALADAEYVDDVVKRKV